MAKEQGFTNLDARELWAIAEDLKYAVSEKTCVTLKRIARNLQTMDEKLANKESSR